MTAVVTDVHYRMALAIIRDLGERGVRVVGCEREEFPNPVGFFSRFCAERRVISGKSYLDGLFEVCKGIFEAENEKPALLAVGAGTLAGIAGERSGRFREVCGMLVAEAGEIARLNDKEAVAALGRELGIPVPEELSEEGAEFPCVVKPRCGEKFGLSAEKRYKIARDRGELRAALGHFREICGEEPVIQRYLTGGGMGCSVIAVDGKVARSMCHRRVREYPVTGGPSSCAEALRDPVLEGYAAAIVERTGFSGPCMVEFKLDENGKAYLLEVNPRVWGTYPLTRAAGAGFSWEWFRLAWNRGNPGSELPAEAAELREGKRMAFTASDLAAGAKYFKNGQRKRALGALGDLLDPRVADGVWEWRDVRPAVRYYGALFKR